MKCKICLKLIDKHENPNGYCEECTTIEDTPIEDDCWDQIVDLFDGIDSEGDGY